MCRPRTSSASGGSPPNRRPTGPRTSASVSSRASSTSGWTRSCCCARSTSARTPTAARRSTSSARSWPLRRERTSSCGGSRALPSVAEPAHLTPAEPSAAGKPVYRRVLLKLSGEALMGDLQYGTDPACVQAIAAEVAAIHARGLEIAIVVGGGNIYRGLRAAARGMDRATGDYMGMLATVLNALALQDALENENVTTRVQSAITISEVAEPYIRRRAIRHLEKGRTVIFAAGTGNPFFTTDTAAALRAIEIEAQLLLKATKVNGVYSADPKKVRNAERFERLTYLDVLSRDLQVMDAAAIALARENRIPILVFSIQESGGFADVVTGRGRFTIITEERP